MINMKKKLSSLCIVVILILSACSRQDQVADTAFKPPIEDIHWGMMPEEVMDTLALSEECIRNSDEGIIILLCEDMNLFGQSADVEMIFDMRSQMGLLYMWAYFNDYSKKRIVEVLSNTYGDYSAIDNEGVPCQWESEKIEDMPEEIQERFRQIQVDSGAWDDEQDVFSKETVWNAVKSQPLVTVTLSDNVLNYNAANMAGYLMISDEDAYEQLLEYLN